MLLMYKETGSGTRPRAQVLKENVYIRLFDILRWRIRTKSYLVATPYSEVDVPVMQFQIDVADTMSDIPADQATLSKQRTGHQLSKISLSKEVPKQVHTFECAYSVISGMSKS